MNNTNYENLLLKYLVLYSYSGICFGLWGGFLSSLIFYPRAAALCMIIGILLGIFLGIVLGKKEDLWF